MSNVLSLSLLIGLMLVVAVAGYGLGWLFNQQLEESLRWQR